eukprot:NODE_11792_length_249_cov_34.730000_g10022_i0.p2 GENE.NODE_11792_length_249_cov_34.730000_g10022_i0~~NODE_11792_length_249_cov_34.730000_g10022_i0.p2  ORF type:complete len:52 (-),score=10.27 NODE_11792_length_249_cov_34.730000_g10022_i0:94-225(-)
MGHQSRRTETVRTSTRSHSYGREPAPTVPVLHVYKYSKHHHPR